MISKFNSTFTDFTPQKKIEIDSDQESIETNDSASQNSSPIQKQLVFISPEIDVKPKDKNFSTVQEKQKYIEDYKRKYKTEICKNWQIKGICPYGDKCCFAHGYYELQEKKHLKITYKTQPCKKFFTQGYCPYGYRCQYLHSDINNYPQFDKYRENIYKEKKIPIYQKSRINIKSYQEKLNQYNQVLESKQNLSKQIRLALFKQLEDQKYNLNQNF